MKIVASGGMGPIEERRPVDRLALDLSGSEKSTVLVVPTADPTPEGMHRSLWSELSYFTELGACAVPLHTEFDTPPSRGEMADKVGCASLIKVLGGDTRQAIERFKLWDLDKELQIAAKNGAVLSGQSAGAICWFTRGHSDSMSYRVEGEPWDYIMVDALNMEPGIIVPHYNSFTEGGELRRDSFAKMIRSVDVGSLPIYGLDNRAAIVIDGSDISSIAVEDGHYVHLLNPEDGLPYDILDTEKAA